MVFYRCTLFYKETIMQWNKVMLDGVHIMVLWFLVYSIMGWIVESIYMSVCNRKFDQQRICKGPYCPIWRRGADGILYITYHTARIFTLFVLGMVLATAIEFLTALIMNKIFGEIWWDYKEKPCSMNYLCMESFDSLGLLYAYAVLLPA